MTYRILADASGEAVALGSAPTVWKLEVAIRRFHHSRAPMAPSVPLEHLRRCEYAMWLRLRNLLIIRFAMFT
jgi:hypothetical protein